MTQVKKEQVFQAVFNAAGHVCTVGRNMKQAKSRWCSEFTDPVHRKWKYWHEHGFTVGEVVIFKKEVFE